MIWIAVAVLAVLALAPAMLAMRRTGPGRERREAALALHRAQLAELERDRAEGRLEAAEYEAAKLEVQRRLLVADADAEPEARPAAGRGLLLVVPLVAVAGLALYLVGGAPLLPAQPLAARIAETERQTAQEDVLVEELRRRLAEMPVDAPQRRQGFELLGSAEARRGRPAEAAAAWRIALAAGFDPTLAAMTGAAIFQAEGKVTPEAVGLFRRALAEAPADAPWRPMAERMLQRAAAP